MGEDWFVCECGEATSDYRGEQCGNCHRYHCSDCRDSLLKQYGLIDDVDDQCHEMLAKCFYCEEKQEVKKEVKKTSKPTVALKSKTPFCFSALSLERTQVEQSIFYRCD